jgi:hypothetical protein
VGYLRLERWSASHLPATPTPRYKFQDRLDDATSYVAVLPASVPFGIKASRFLYPLLSHFRDFGADKFDDIP